MPNVNFLPDLSHPIYFAITFILGSCIGSFLNVVIYRLPRGLSVNQPRRSFCPNCKSPIPWWRNIPLWSWLALRGKCADCGEKIAARYFFVELICGLLFVLVWWVMLPLCGGFEWTVAHWAILCVWVFVAAMLALSMIDIELMIIPLPPVFVAAAAAVAGAFFMPQLPDLSGWWVSEGRWWEGLRASLFGGVIGYFGLWSVVLLGKLLFGKMKWEFEQPVPWHLEEPKNDTDPIMFHMGDQAIGWWDLFFRKSDKLMIDAQSVIVNGKASEAGQVVIRETEIRLSDGTSIALENLQSLEGTANRALVPREAMGMGDVFLLGVIGLLFGWLGVIFTLFSSSIITIIAALLGRIGFGRQLPFGPFLFLGSLLWLFGGWKLAQWYLQIVL